jgi:hypothetical protein
MGGIRGSYRKLRDVGSGKGRWSGEIKLERARGREEGNFVGWTG